MKKTFTLVFIALLAILSLSACDVLTGAEDTNGAIKGSGHIAAETVNASPELGGKVAEVLANESDIVNEGDVLIRFDDALMLMIFFSSINKIAS